MSNFGRELADGVRDSPVSLALACAIACQESAYTWFDREPFVRGRSPAERMILVLDNVSPRRAYPQDTAAFQRDRRFRDLAPALIAASDASRAARGYPRTGRLLYGYGLFQYDLQHIETDPAFWRNRLWGDVPACTARFARELGAKIRRHPGDLAAGVAAYNGRGANAREYARIVLRFRDLAAAQLGVAPT